jgi:hypothetical protein
VLRAFHGLDDVDLEEAEPANRREHVRGRAFERLGADGDSPCFLDADLHRCTRPAVMVTLGFSILAFILPDDDEVATNR